MWENDDDDDHWIHTLQKKKDRLQQLSSLYPMRTYRNEKHAHVDDIRAGTRKDAERTQQVKHLQRMQFSRLPVSHGKAKRRIPKGDNIQSQTRSEARELSPRAQKGCLF